MACNTQTLRASAVKVTQMRSSEAPYPLPNLCHVFILISPGSFRLAL